MVQSYRLGVAGHMLKPVDYKQFVERSVIDLYWIKPLFKSLVYERIH
jgi:hypothetical protein